MYTVLIFDNRTAESFKYFRPLFVEMIRKGELGICEWSRDLADSKIEVALPKIYEMVGDKKEWRAIIIQSEIEDENGEFATSPVNPFDYVSCREEYLKEINRARDAKSAYDDVVKALDPDDPEYNELKKQAKIACEPNFNMHEESKIPLVILTQMLGGVPKQSPIFIDGDPVIDETTQKVVSNVITVKDEEADILHRRLERKYHFQANRPKEIVLIAARPSQDENLEKVKAAWTNYDELESSQFWSYNHYATCCRFLTYEVEQKGSVQAQGDLLRLWLTVGLLASNPLDPSSFQAYYLYTVKLKLDREQLGKTFRTTAAALSSASRYLNRSIIQDQKRFMTEKIDPPEYDVHISVGIEEHKIGDVFVSENDYGLAAQDNEGDVDQWISDRDESDKNLTKMRRVISRSVESAAERMRGNWEYNPSMVEPLSNFQSKEFSEQLKDTYQEILDDQVLLPFDEISALQRKKHEKQKTMVDIIKGRMDAKKLVKGYGITAALVLLSVLPSVIYGHKTEISVLTPVLGCLAISALIYFVTLIVVALIQRNDLLEELSKYNALLLEIKEKIESNAQAYSMFLSGVGSHMRGSSYLNILQHKIFRREDLTQQKLHHLEEINKFRLVVEDWARSMYIECDFDLVDQDSAIEFDEYDIPDFESLYTLEYGKKVKIPINKSGELTSSYSFITGLEIVREELYDDVIFARDLGGRDS